MSCVPPCVGSPRVAGRAGVGGAVLLMILLLVLFKQSRVPARQLDAAAADVRLLDLRGRLERVAGGDDERGVLADLERADAVRHAEDLRGVERDRLERVVLG